jgi:hypothetical protein
VKSLRISWQKNWPLLMSFASLFLYLPLLKSFFWQDDWYFLRLSQAQNIAQVWQFFSPWPNELSTPMYRPLTSQFFFLLMRSIFGMHSQWWYLVSILLTGLLFFAVWKWLKELGVSSRVRMVSQLLFAFSATHFYRISYLSAVQEIVMALCVVGALYFSAQKKMNVVLLLFFFGLLSKETAVVTLPLLVAQMLYLKQWHWKEVFSAGFMTLGYLLLRFGVYGVDRVGDEQYTWVFSVARAVHTGIWYTVWSLGLPELTINYVGDGFRLLPHFWTDFPEFGRPVIGSFLLTIGSLALAAISGLWLRAQKKDAQWLASLAFPAVVLLMGLLPLLFLPDHKFPLGQTLGLLGLSLGFGFLLEKAQKALIFLSLAIFFLANSIALAFAYERHYAVTRSTIARTVYEELEPRVASWPKNQGIYFLNDPNATHPIWGSSKQIDQAINSEHFARVVFESDVPILFEDMIKKSDLSKEYTWLELDSRNFLE